jgi:hypothetical protein
MVKKVGADAHDRRDVYGNRHAGREDLNRQRGTNQSASVNHEQLEALIESLDRPERPRANLQRLCARG